MEKENFSALLLKFFCGFDLTIQIFSVLSRHLCQCVLLVAKMLLTQGMWTYWESCHHSSLAVAVIDGLLCLSVMKNVSQVEGNLQYTEKFIMAIQMMAVMILQLPCGSSL